MGDWVEAGERAPAFSLTADDGSKVRLADLKGRPVVLYFYPKDDTPGCTREACAFRDRLGRIEIPVLIVWGLKDSAFQPYQLARWQSLLPHATVTTIDAAGHWPHEEEPALVIAAFQRFLP